MRLRGLLPVSIAASPKPRGVHIAAVLNPVNTSPFVEVKVSSPTADRQVDASRERGGVRLYALANTENDRRDGTEVVDIGSYSTVPKSHQAVVRRERLFKPRHRHGGRYYAKRNIVLRRTDGRRGREPETAAIAKYCKYAP